MRSSRSTSVATPTAASLSPGAPATATPPAESTPRPSRARSTPSATSRASRPIFSEGTGSTRTVAMGDWATQWLESKRSLKPKTRLGYESLLRSRVLPHLGGFRLAGMQRIHVEQWISQMQDEDLSPSRIRQAFNVLAAMLDAAITNDMIARNVARGIDLPRLRPARRRFLSQQQVAALANAIDPAYRVLVLVLAYSGLRWGEAVALRRGRCDLLRRRLHVLESATEVGGQLVWGSPKTHRVRSVSLPTFVCEELAQHLAAQVGDDADALVFTTEIRRPRSPQRLPSLPLASCRRGGRPAGGSHPARTAPHRRRPDDRHWCGSQVDPGPARPLHDRHDV